VRDGNERGERPRRLVSDDDPVGGLVEGPHLREYMRERVCVCVCSMCVPFACNTDGTSSARPCLSPVLRP
jgi:hypothetical protein